MNEDELDQAARVSKLRVLRRFPNAFVRRSVSEQWTKIVTDTPGDDLCCVRGTDERLAWIDAEEEMAHYE